MSTSLPPETIAEIERVTNCGERVTHLYRNDCYYAHLSIYHFALKWCGGADVLDAGCGSGYGCDYLIRNGARSVLGVDNAAEALEFCQRYFKQPGLVFQQLDLRNICSLGEKRFDVIYSSNTLEHIPGVDDFFSAAASLLRPGGHLIMAVPPVISEEARIEEGKNPHHVNIRSPEEWLQVLEHHFQHVACYRHIFNRSDIQLNFAGRPENCLTNEKDFSFPRCDTPADMRTLGTLTAIFRGDGA